MTERPAFQGRSGWNHPKGPTYRARPLNEDEGYDEIEVFSVARWKESELSGDEYRWSHRAQAIRKGVVLAARAGHSQFDALISLLPEIQLIREWRFLSVDECAQLACRATPDVLFVVKQPYDPTGTMIRRSVGYEVRAFCNAHLLRGDCGLDDADTNYERLAVRENGEWVLYPEPPKSTLVVPMSEPGESLVVDASGYDEIVLGGEGE